MTEFEEFQRINEHKSPATQLSYKRQYTKLYKLTGGNIADVSQKKILEIIYANASNPNQISSLTNIALLVRKMNKMPVNELVNDREKNKTVIEEHVASRHKRKEYMRLYYQSNKEKWITYRQTRLQKLKDLTACGTGAAPLTYGQARHACCSRCAHTGPVLQLEANVIPRRA